MIINKIIKPIDTENKDLLDYKFFCFNGEMKFFKIDFGRFVEHQTNYYSRNGEYLDFGELTFFPAAGMGAFASEKYDIKLGKLLRIKT